MSYILPDEARPGALRNYVVRPDAPLLAAMLAGAWLAWPWFAFNGIAMGSPTRRRELIMCAAAFAGTALLAFALLAMVRGGWLTTETEIRLGLLAIATWKLAMSYWLVTLQSRTFHVYEYYGGPVRGAGGVLGAGFLLRGLVLGLVDDPLWVIIVAGGV